MVKSIKVTEKKRGRPATGRDPVSAVRLPAELTAAVDKWGEVHDANRSEAIRRLVELGLKAETPATPVSKPARASSARELAADDRHDDLPIGATRRTRPAPKPAHQGARRISRGAGRSAEGEEMSPSRPAARPWTSDEEKKLDDLLKAGKEAAEIATALQRTRQAIYARLQRLYRKRMKLSDG